jgi:hypothetical protein
VDDLRKRVEKAKSRGVDEATSIIEGAGDTSNPAMINSDLAKRLGALKSLRHTYLLKRFGSHKVWCLAIPTTFTDWPHEDLKGGMSTVVAKLNDRAERFTQEQRKHLSNASQEGLKWVHKAMTVAANPKKTANAALISRWFADDSSKSDDLIKAGATLNSGLKKIAAKLKSGHLIYTDSVSERGTSANEGTEAFVWGDRLDVVYIEEEFFGKRNTLSGLTNWARIVVHELTHREIKTQDYAYEHQGISPRKLSAAKAIENADSWAWFCADCAGALTAGTIKNALDR